MSTRMYRVVWVTLFVALSLSTSVSYVAGESAESTSSESKKQSDEASKQQNVESAKQHSVESAKHSAEADKPSKDVEKDSAAEAGGESKPENAEEKNEPSERRPHNEAQHKQYVEEANKEYYEGRRRFSRPRYDDEDRPGSEDRPPRRFDGDGTRRYEERGKRYDDEDRPRYGGDRYGDRPQRRYDNDGPRRSEDGGFRRERKPSNGPESHVGCVVFRLFKQKDGNPGAEYLLLKGRRGDGWIPPKGYNLFETETGERDAALLKLHAKTGFRRDDVHVVPGFVKRTEYTFLDKVKSTVFYLAELLVPDVDMKRLSKYYTDFRWFTLEEALSATRHKDIGEVLQSCEDHLRQIKVIT